MALQLRNATRQVEAWWVLLSTVVSEQTQMNDQLSLLAAFVNSIFSTRTSSSIRLYK